MRGMTRMTQPRPLGMRPSGASVNTLRRRGGREQVSGEKSQKLLPPRHCFQVNFTLLFISMNSCNSFQET